MGRRFCRSEDSWQTLVVHYSRLTLLETFRCITFMRDSKRERERLPDRYGSIWEIEGEDRTDAKFAVNFDASLVGFDHGFDQT